MILIFSIEFVDHIEPVRQIETWLKKSSEMILQSLYPRMDLIQLLPVNPEPAHGNAVDDVRMGESLTPII